MSKVWMRQEPYQQEDGRWVPQLTVWEEAIGGAVECARILPAAGITHATEAEARAHTVELAQRWLLRRPSQVGPRALDD